jgi:transposase
MEAISYHKTLQQISADHAVHPIQVSQWKEQLLAWASELFSHGKKSNDKDGDRQAKESQLFRQVCRLKMVFERLNRNSLASDDANVLRKLVDDEDPHLSFVSLPLHIMARIDMHSMGLRAFLIRNLAPQFLVIQPGVFRAWLISIRSRLSIRSGRLMS